MSEYPETVFNIPLVRDLGDIGTVLGEFLDKQTARIQQQLMTEYPEVPVNAVDKMLNAFITLEGTKRPLHKEEVQLTRLDQDAIDFILDELEKARILRLEEEHYELAHDTLAQRIAERRSADEVAFLEVRKLIKDRYNLYPTTKTLLNANELQLIKAFEQRLADENSLRREEDIYINRSRRENRRRRITLALLVSTAIVVLAVFSIYSYRQSERAQIAQEKAVQSLIQLEEEQQQRAEAQYQNYLSRGRALMAISEFDQAIQEFETALSHRPEGQEALELKGESASKLNTRTDFDRFIQEGDRFFEAGAETYVDALGKYQAALRLGFNNSLAESKINTVSGRLEGAYENFVNVGNIFFQAQGYQLALDHYRQALRIKPNDQELRRKISDCRNRLNE